MSIIRRNLILSMGFGIAMGVVFPLYANFFVVFKSSILFWFFLFGCILAGICVGSIAFLINKRTIIRAITLVTGEMENIAGGGNDLSRRMKVESSDAVGKLVGGFNDFATVWDTIFSTFKKTVEQSHLSGEELRTVVNHSSHVLREAKSLVERSTELQSWQNENLNSTRDALSGLNKSTLFVLTHVVDLFSHLETLSQRLASQSRSISKILSSVDDINTTIGINRNAERSFYAVSAALDKEIEKTVTTMRKQESKINDILGQVEDATARISILAINAAIEAARAGESGKGFRVLAGEVAELARTMSSMTAEAKQTVNDSFSDTRLTHEVLQRHNKILGALRDEIGRNVDALTDETTAIDRITNTVDASYEEVGNVLSIVQGNVEGLKQNSELMNETMSRLISSNSDMSSIVKELDEITKTMESNVQITLEQTERLTDILTRIHSKVTQYKTSE